MTSLKMSKQSHCAALDDYRARNLTRVTQAMERTSAPAIENQNPMRSTP